jgi:hypothetical protein
MKKIFILFILSIIFATQSIAKQPTEKTIKKWLNQGDFTIENIQNIYLLDYERAYLAEVTFTGDNTVLKKGLVLVRPELDEAEFIPSFPQDYIVTDLDHDGVSEVIFSKKFSYDTYTSYKRSLVQLHDYKRFELYSIEYKEEKNCKLCLAEDIQWGFEDFNRDKIKDLKQDYALHVQSPHHDFVIKEEIQELEFNPKGLKFPFKQGQLNLSAMEISKDVIDRKPVMKTLDFSLQDERVYCFLDFRNVKHEDTVTYYWVHEKLGKVIERTQRIHPSSQYRTWLFKDLRNEEKYLGDWVIIVSDKNMNILGSKEFTISKTTIPDINATYADTNITSQDMNNTKNESNTTN